MGPRRAQLACALVALAAALLHAERPAAARELRLEWGPELAGAARQLPVACGPAGALFVREEPSLALVWSGVAARELRLLTTLPPEAARLDLAPHLRPELLDAERRQLALPAPSEDAVWVWELEREGEPRRVELEGAPAGVAFVGSELWILDGLPDGFRLLRWDATRGAREVLREPEGLHPLPGLSPAPDGSALAFRAELTGGAGLAPDALFRVELGAPPHSRPSARPHFELPLRDGDPLLWRGRELLIGLEPQGEGGGAEARGGLFLLDRAGARRRLGELDEAEALTSLAEGHCALRLPSLSRDAILDPQDEVYLLPRDTYVLGGAGRVLALLSRQGAGWRVRLARWSLSSD